MQKKAKLSENLHSPLLNLHAKWSVFQIHSPSINLSLGPFLLNKVRRHVKEVIIYTSKFWRSLYSYWRNLNL